MIKIWVFAGLLLGCSLSTPASAEVIRCHESSTGWCEVRPVPPPRQGPAALRVPGPVIVGEGLPYSAGNEQYRRCPMEGAVFNEQYHKCFLKITNPQEIDRRVDGAHMDVDPACANKKSGETYRREVTDRDGRPAIATVTCR
jgi:hypothetical protein